MPFSRAILSGYAPDGGLYVPTEVPQVSLSKLREWSGLSFAQLCQEILCLYIQDEIPLENLEPLVQSAFQGFSCSDIVPLVKLGDLMVAELFHGPTLAFKDFGQQVLCKLIDYFATLERRSVTAIAATTGDTGPAAIEAVAGSKYMRIFVFYPRGQISKLQEAQMTTVDDPNVVVTSFVGGGDDMDPPIKNVTTDREFAAKHGLCSINSVNWGRGNLATPALCPLDGSNALDFSVRSDCSLLLGIFAGSRCGRCRISCGLLHSNWCNGKCWCGHVC